MNASSLPPGAHRFITLVETAELLGISPRRASALVRSGELPAIRIGVRGPWRVDRAVLEAYIEALYEETRRTSIWNGSNTASIVDLRLDDRTR